MKKQFVSILFLALLSTGAWAQPFTTGYSSLVVFTDGHRTSPAGETESACQYNEMRIIANYLSMFPAGSVAVDASQSLPCGPRTSQVPDLDLEAWKALRIPPVCLSCPLLSPETFHVYYPDHESKIKGLYYQYGINEYNQKLIELQQQFDLEAFEKEVFMLNNDLNQIQK